MSLRAWQLAAFAYVLVLVLVALEVPLALNLSRRVDAEVKAQAANQATLVAASAAGRLDEPGQLDALADTAARAVGGRVILTDARGILLADSGAPVAPGSSYASRPEVAEALRGGVAQGTRRSRTLDERLLYTAVPILDAGRRAGAVRVTQSVDAVHAEVRRDTIALVAVGAGALLLGLIVAWLFAGSLTRPLRALTAVARRVGAGDLDARADERAGAREHREVAHAFNDSTARLGTALVAQREFVGNAAHQLRTPLTGLRLRLESASLKAGDAGLRRDLEAGEREVDRLARTVSDLLVLARGDDRPEVRAPLRVADVAARAVERWQHVAEERDVALRLHGEGEPAEVLASGEDLGLILDNLIENAVDHTAPGTAVDVTVAAAPGVVRVLVADRGPGLRRGEETRVFERFYRGSSSARRPDGSGLGLAIVEELARRWGGTAAIANREGGGAQAELRLPRAARRAAVAAGARG